MKAHTALLAFALATSVWAGAQAPTGSTGRKSASTPDAHSAPNNSSDASANGPVSANQNDSSLQSQIENALRNEPALSNSHIVVTVTSESINLSGTVGSGKDKQAAERVAQSFDGNRQLKDNLMVTGRGHSDLAPTNPR